MDILIHIFLALYRNAEKRVYGKEGICTEKIRRKLESGFYPDSLR